MPGPNFSKIFTGRQLYSYSFLHKMRDFPFQLFAQETKGWAIMSAAWTFIVVSLTIPVHLAINTKANKAYWAAQHEHYEPFKPLQKKDWVD